MIRSTRTGYFVMRWVTNRKHSGIPNLRTRGSWPIFCYEKKAFVSQHLHHRCHSPFNSKLCQTIFLLLVASFFEEHHHCCLWKRPVSQALFRLPAQICFFGISRMILESLDSKNTHEMRFLIIGSKPHLEVVWNATPIGFLRMCLSPDAQIGFLFCVTHNATQNDDVKSRVMEVQFVPASSVAEFVWCEEFCTVTWQHDCLEDAAGMYLLHISFLFCHDHTCVSVDFSP